METKHQRSAGPRMRQHLVSLLHNTPSTPCLVNLQEWDVVKRSIGLSQLFHTHPHPPPHMSVAGEKNPIKVSPVYLFTTTFRWSKVPVAHHRCHLGGRWTERRDRGVSLHVCRFSGGGLGCGLRSLGSPGLYIALKG